MTSNNEEDKESFLLNLSNTFKEIVDDKDKKIDEMRSSMINERFEVIRIYMFVYQLSKSLNDMTEFITQEEITDKLNFIERELKKYLVCLIMNDIDLIIE